MRIVGDIAKWEKSSDGTLLIEGICSTADLDAQGEVVAPDAMRKALPEYLRVGSVREMHQPIAAGKPVSAFVDEDGKTHLTAKIVDKGTIQKIEEKVLKAFSIGGKALKKAGNTITELLLKEVSVVDIGANPATAFEICKFDDNKPNPMIDHKFFAKAFNMPDTATEQDVLNEIVKRSVPVPADIAWAKAEIEAIKKSIPATPKDFTAEITKLNTELGDIKKVAETSAAAAKKSQLEVLKQEAAKAGKVIPLKDELFFKMEVVDAADMISKLQPILKLIRTTPQQPKKADGTVLKGDDLSAHLAEKRAENIAWLNEQYGTRN